MIEILFSESASGSMRVAKCKAVAVKADGPTAVFVAGKKKPPKKEGCGWIEGMSSEVICLNFMLDIGDIKKEIDSNYRRELIYSMYAHKGWGMEDETGSELRSIVCEMERLKDYLEDGEEIRIWYSDMPYSVCGFYHLCHLFCNAWKEYRNKIHVVRMPEYVIRFGSTVIYNGWGEVPAEGLVGFLQYEKELSAEEMNMFSMIWSGLVEDNSPLRAVVNGKVAGVPESFYDFLILKKITKEPVKEAMLIGTVLGNYPMGISDWWYARRINYLIDTGVIKIAWDSDNEYQRMLCLA